MANATYADPQLQMLRAPVDDAQALADVLSDPLVGAFDVELLMDEEEPVIRRRVASFFSGRSPDDTLLLHFSCHGLKDDNGDLYFAARDTSVAALDATGLSSEFVHRQMNKSRSRRVVLLLDCCYSGAFGEGMHRRSDSSVDLEKRFEGRGRTVLTASSAMEYAFEGASVTLNEGVASVFTGAVVEGLRTGAADLGGDGYVSVEELYEYVYREVKARTPSQTPRRWSFDVEGEVILARSVRPVGVPLSAEITHAIESPFRDVRLAAVAELGRLAMGRHRGYAASAQAALNGMLDDDSNLVRRAAEDALEAAGVGERPPPEIGRISPGSPRTSEHVSAVQLSEAAPLRAEPPSSASLLPGDDAAGLIRPNETETDSASAVAAPIIQPDSDSEELERIEPDEKSVPAGDWLQTDEQTPVGNRRERRPRWASVEPRTLVADELVVAAAFNPNSSRIAVGLGNGVCVLDVETGTEHWRNLHESGATQTVGVAWSDDGRLIAVLSSSGLMTFEAATGRQLAARPEGGSTGVAFGPNGTRLVTGDGEYSSATLEPLVRYEPSRFAVGATQVARVFGREVEVVDLGEQSVGGRVHLRADDKVYSLCLNRAGHLLAVAGLSTVVWNTTASAVLLEFPGVSYGVAFSPDDAELAVAGTDQLCIVDLSTELVVYRDPDVAPLHLAFSPDGQHLSVAHRRGVTLHSVTG